MIATKFEKAAGCLWQKMKTSLFLLFIWEVLESSFRTHIAIQT